LFLLALAFNAALAVPFLAAFSFLSASPACSAHDQLSPAPYPFLFDAFNYSFPLLVLGYLLNPPEPSRVLSQSATLIFEVVILNSSPYFSALSLHQLGPLLVNPNTLVEVVFNLLQRTNCYCDAILETLRL
jgi:hypothetical protein